MRKCFLFTLLCVCSLMAQAQVKVAVKGVLHKGIAGRGSCFGGSNLQLKNFLGLKMSYDFFKESKHDVEAFVEFGGADVDLFYVHPMFPDANENEDVAFQNTFYNSRADESVLSYNLLKVGAEYAYHFLPRFYAGAGLEYVRLSLEGTHDNALGVLAKVGYQADCGAFIETGAEFFKFMNNRSFRLKFPGVFLALGYRF